MAKDEIEAISSGTHSRFVVDVGKTVERLKAKARQVGGDEITSRLFRDGA